MKKVKMTKYTTSIDLREVQKANQKIGIEEENPNPGQGRDSGRGHDHNLKVHDIWVEKLKVGQDLVVEIDDIKDQGDQGQKVRREVDQVITNQAIDEDE